MSTISASTTSTTAFKVTSDTTGNLVLQTGSGPTTAVTIDTSQNVGLGVTPSANTLSKGFDLVNGAGMFGYGNNTYLSANSYYDSAWKYKATAAAAFLGMESGSFRFNIASSGSAGAAITFTEAMRLDASGNLLLNTTTGYGKFTVQNNAGTGKVLLDNYVSIPTTENVMSIYADASRGYIQSYNNGYKDIVICGSGGNLGIGTTSPAQKLDVNGVAKASNYYYQSSASAYATPSSTTLTMTSTTEGSLFLISASNHSGTSNVSHTMWMLSYSGNGGSVVTQIATGGNYTPTIAVSGATVTITNNSGGSRIIYASFIRLL